ncbi:MAG: ATP-binding cassette domain-containing protein [Paracoccaceae bacterium]
MADALACEGVAVRYPYAAADAVGPVSFAVARGERVLLLGPSGAGKSSLLHALTGVIPASLPGTRRGDIRLWGHPVGTRPPSGWAGEAGFLFQDAGQTLAGFTVEEEIAFAAENRQMPRQRLRARVAAAMARVGLPETWRSRHVARLSGGERQLVALAALLAQGARLTIADEPTASLAPQAAQRLATLLLAPGRSALVVDHRLGPILDRIDRCLVLGPAGRFLAEGPPSEVFGEKAEILHHAAIWTPLAARLRLALPELEPGLSVERIARRLPDSETAEATLRGLLLPDPAGPARPCLTLERAACAPPFGPVVLRDVSLKMNAGEVLALIGPNGAGKSTLAACLAGLVPLRSGQRHGPRGAVVFQSAEAHFSRESVTAELEGLGLDAAALRDALDYWRLEAVAAQHPFTLSAGQKRRLALALLTEPGRWPVLVLDEPTAGLDWHGTERVALRLRALARAGQAVAIVTHDADFALRVADRTALVAQGTLQACGPSPEILSDIGLLSRAGLAPPEALPVLRALGGS